MFVQVLNMEAGFVTGEHELYQVPGWDKTHTRIHCHMHTHKPVQIDI